MDNSSRAYLSFELLVIGFLAQHLIVPELGEIRIPVGKAISRDTFRLSNEHLEVAPPPSQLQSHAMELDLSNEEAPPLVSTDVPSSSTVPPAATTIDTYDPTITDAIAILFAHMDVIHKDLVERMGQVHERVDLIIEHQERDIKAIYDTLSVLSR